MFVVLYEEGDEVLGSVGEGRVDGREVVEVDAEAGGGEGVDEGGCGQGEGPGWVFDEENCDGEVVG